MSKPGFSIQWHITDQCDQKCIHCYLYGEGVPPLTRPKVMDLSTCIAIVDDLIKCCEKMEATPRISLTGGDPLLHTRFWDILEYIHEKGVRVSILGNPFWITSEVAQRLKNLGVTRFQLSLDGMPDIHDSWRKAGSFKSTEQAIVILKNAGLKVNIMSTVSKANADEIPKIARWVANHDVDVYAFARHCPAGKTNDDDIFTPQEYRNFLKTMWDVFSELAHSKTEYVLKDHLWLLFLSEIGLFDPEPTDNVAVSGCGIGISHLTILADGEVYACRRFASPVGKVPDSNLYDIFNGDKMEEYRDWKQFEKCTTCNLLQYCRGCMAVAHSVVGRWTAADPQCWKA